MSRDAWTVKIICIFSINSTLTLGKIFASFHSTPQGLVWCFHSSFHFSCLLHPPSLPLRSPVRPLIQCVALGKVPLLLLHLLHEEQRDFKTALHYWNLMQTLLECLHRPNCAQRRCALLASKLKQNHSLPSVIQRWGRAEKLHSISPSPSHILSGAAAQAKPAF